MDTEQMQQKVLDCMLDLFAAVARADCQMTIHTMEDHLYRRTSIIISRISLQDKNHKTEQS